jgi:peptidoglycan/LPS O-acetylase OafA/YrhL
MADAGVAVKSFFIISGFYMALILDRKYDGRSASGRWLFWSNRFLRIYPLYWLTLLGGLLFYAAASFKLGFPADRFQLWMGAWDAGRTGSLILLGAIQTTIVGLELPTIFSYSASDGFEMLRGGMDTGSVFAWRFNMLPHGWSISVELMFYLVAPWLVRWSSARLWFLIAAVLAGTIATLGLGPALLAGQATYHYFPFQLSYFALGILGYRLRSQFAMTGVRFWIVAGVAGIGLLWGGVLPVLVQYVVLVPLTFFVIPALFAATCDRPADRTLGDLSYAMYLIHVPARWILLALQGITSKADVAVSGVQLIAVTVVLAVVARWVVERPIEQIRARRAGKARPA